MYYTQKWRAEPPEASPGPVSPRVSVIDYLANMDRFRTEAARRGIAIAFLTRPHKLPPDELSRNSTWRIGPQIQRGITSLGPRNDVPVLDAQHYFERFRAELFSDECHFTPQGYERMARLVRDELVPKPKQDSTGRWQRAAGERRDIRER